MRLWDIYHSGIPSALQELAQTPQLQRLQDVGMNCGCEYTAFARFAGLAPYSRFDHSMGVGLIVWHFTRDMTQASAGLLHDIATPVFAHVVDFLHGDHMAQESTESETAQWIIGSHAVGQVLCKHGIPVAEVTDYHRYPVADNDPPRLSADRLEYTLGNAVNYGFVSREQAKSFYDDLLVGCNETGEPELIFSHAPAALGFAQAALQCSQVYVSDEDRYAMQRLSELLRAALEAEILTPDDLHTVESKVIEKLQLSPLGERWREFCSYRTMARRSSPGTGDAWRQIRAKKRCIDPYIRDCGRVSAVFPEFQDKLEAFRSAPQEHWLMAF